MLPVILLVIVYIFKFLQIYNLYFYYLEMQNNEISGQLNIYTRLNW